MIGELLFALFAPAVLAGTVVGLVLAFLLYLINADLLATTYGIVFAGPFLAGVIVSFKIRRL